MATWKPDGIYRNSARLEIVCPGKCLNCDRQLETGMLSTPSPFRRRVRKLSRASKQKTTWMVPSGERVAMFEWRQQRQRASLSL